MTPPTFRPPVPPAARLDSIDLLRGLVMVLMALDHTRDFFHAGALRGVDPLDLTQTTPALFLTRWITHYCAPTFILLAGLGAFLSTGRGKSPRDLSWFLLTRGAWLVVLEWTLVQWAGWNFAFDLHHHNGAVLWAIGWSMITLAALIHLPVRIVTAFGLLLIVGHNALDSIRAENLGAWGRLWQILHQGGPVRFGSGHVLYAAYPLVPWIGVMAAGYGLGAWLQSAPDKRRRRLLTLGAALTVGFVVLRFSNLYGNARLWSPQSMPWQTVAAFLDCTKYPPSLCYLLMTLGPALLLLAAWDAGAPRALRPLLAFGRVPMFFYLLHLPLLHGLAVAAAFAAQGRADWLYGNGRSAAPADAGYGLAGVYLAWAVGIAVLYPVCRRFAAYKQGRRAAWLSYF
ncbi:MAG: heparan-alpha-glucosaminide N-acetyltransferase domain-containing protein [Verrucomicrobiota bacterium]